MYTYLKVCRQNGTNNPNGILLYPFGTLVI